MTETNADLNGRRLVTLRDLEGMTQAALADALGVTQGFVSHVESGSKPLPEAVAVAASVAFRVPVSFFAVPDSVEPLGQYTFRRKARARAKDERRVQALFREAARLFQQLSTASGYRTEMVGVFAARADDPEHVAHEIRSGDGLGPEDPVRNATRLIERHGVGVVTVLERSDVEVSDHTGISRPSPFDDRPLVAATRPLPGAVLRLTLAHELAHVIFDRNLAGPVRSTRAAQETRAFRLAGALLVPEAVMRQRVTESLTLHGYLRIKADYGMSVAALLHRARDLGLISAGRYRSLSIQHSSQGWRHHEPVDVAVETPLLVAQALGRVHGRNGVAAASQAYGIKPDLIRRWIDQPAGEPDDGAEVIDIAGRRATMTGRPVSGE